MSQGHGWVGVRGREGRGGVSEGGRRVGWGGKGGVKGGEGRGGVGGADSYVSVYMFGRVSLAVLRRE